MTGVVGTCNLCGGDVVGLLGPWMSVAPPPPPQCSRCGAQMARGPVLPMVPTPPTPRRAP